MLAHNSAKLRVRQKAEGGLRARPLLPSPDHYTLAMINDQWHSLYVVATRCIKLYFFIDKFNFSSILYYN